MFSEKFKALRQSKGLSQTTVGKTFGVTQQAVAKWENGKSTPDTDMLAKLAAYFGVSMDALLDMAPEEPPAPAAPAGYAGSMIPVIGTVRAGYGRLAFEEDYGTESANVKDPDSYFYLVVKGDSMLPRIQDGDLALVHKQQSLENGDLGVVIYGDEAEGTLKKFVRRGTSVVLKPFNPAYPEKIISGYELENLHIVGKVVRTVTSW